MNDMNKLEQLAPIADEMLSGLHADEMMKRRILTAAREKSTPRRASVRRFVPAMSCAALAIACVGMLGLRLRGAQTQAAKPVAIRSIAAGDHTLDNSVRVADVGSRARVKSVAPSENSLFAVADGDIPLVAVNGCVYRMLTAPKDVDSSLVGDTVGSVAAFSDRRLWRRTMRSAAVFPMFPARVRRFMPFPDWMQARLSRRRWAARCAFSSASAMRAGVPADRAWRTHSPSEGW